MVWNLVWAHRYCSGWMKGVPIGKKCCNGGTVFDVIWLATSPRKMADGSGRYNQDKLGDWQFPDLRGGLCADQLCNLLGALPHAIHEHQRFVAFGKDLLGDLFVCSSQADHDWYFADQGVISGDHASGH